MGFRFSRKKLRCVEENVIVETVILACNTIRDELEKAAHEIKCEYPFMWIESGLHLNPDSLRRRMQEELDAINKAQRVLLGFGFCGNSLIGLRSQKFPDDLSQS